MRKLTLKAYWQGGVSTSGKFGSQNERQTILGRGTVQHYNSCLNCYPQNIDITLVFPPRL